LIFDFLFFIFYFLFFIFYFLFFIFYFLFLFFIWAQVMAPGCGARLTLVTTGWWRQACGGFGCGRFVGNY
jgi:hypothetical protein